MSWSGRRGVLFGAAVVGSLAVVFAAFFPASMASAVGTFSTRSLTLQGVGTVGGSQFSGTVNDLFNFTTFTSSNVGSIQFDYCTTAGGTCTVPPGLSTTSATLSGTQGGATGFTLGTIGVTNGHPYITRTAANINSSVALSYTLLGVTNPSATNTSFYVHITSYTGANLGGTAVDNGTVAASTANQITLTGTMPESLVFCAGATISLNGGGVPDCTTATSGAVSFNQLFSPTATATATSQMAASTNASTGYVITVNGPTLTAGSSTVTAMSTSGPSTNGISQFGMNLKQNITPAVGTEVTPTSNNANYRGEAIPSSGYDLANDFKYVNGGAVADSAQGSGAAPTDIQIYTSAYIVNVNGAQAVGTYTTTLTYICTPTY